jgi:MYXO-CTERM domain-containing protein
MEMKRVLATAVAALCLTASQSFAAVYYLATDSNSGRSAEADFSVSGNVQTVTQANLAKTAANEPVFLLDAVLFNSTGLQTSTSATGIGSPLLVTSANLTPVNTVLLSGATVTTSAVLNDTLTGAGNPGAGNVGGEWGYVGSASGTAAASAIIVGNTTVAGLVPAGGISSTGLGIFGSSTFFNGANQDGPGNGALAGPSYGIAPAAGIGSSPSISGTAVESMAVTFTLLITDPDNFSLDSIKNVAFMYGTGLDEPVLPAGPPFNPQVTTIPEPASLSVWGLLGLAGVALRRRRKAV